MTRILVGDFSARRGRKKENENKKVTLESRDGAVVRALASHQCGPGSILRLIVIYMNHLNLSLSSPYSERFFPGSPVLQWFFTS